MIKFLKTNILQGLNSINLAIRSTDFCLPDFLVIGAQKSGTSSLYSYLIQHSGVIPAQRKEIHYFGNPHNRQKGKGWYTQHFCKNYYKKSLDKKLGYSALTGEATPYMHKPYVVKYVHEILPSAKLISIFRNPTDRAYSHYQHQVRHGKEALSFENAIEQSPIKIPDNQMDDEWAYYNNNLRSYITRGLYADHLESWYKYYHRDQILILDSNVFFNKPVEVLKNVLEFLNLRDHEFNKKFVVNHAGNYTGLMNDRTREFLDTLYKPYNRRFAQLTGFDFGWPT